VRDVYELDSTTDGTAVVTVSTATAPPDTLALSFLSADGALLQRVALTSPSARATQAVTAGATYVQIDAGASVTYTVAADFNQAPVVVQGVTPLNGGPGTPVVIAGRGFSTDATQNLVFFGGIAARIVAATATRLDVVVPANAIDGPIRVAVRSLQATGPAFAAGNATPLPPIVVDAAPRQHRLHPALGVQVDLERLIVHFDPAATRADVDTLAAQVGASVSGVLPEFNGYVFRFAGRTSLRSLDATRQQLRGAALVDRVSYDVLRPVVQGPITFDAAGNASYADGQQHPIGLAASMALVFNAILAIRSTPPFDVSLSGLASDPLRPVTVAVLDTGFHPPDDLVASEFTDAQGALVVNFISTEGGSSLPGNPLPSTSAYSDAGDHGTEVTSIIAAVNSGVPGAGGALNSLFAPGEPPYRVLAYRAASGADGIDQDAELAALLDAGRRQVDVINMSYSAAHATLADADADAASSKQYLQGMPKTLAVIAAGNHGIDARFAAPANLSLQLDNVVTVGATAVLNDPGSRSIFGGAKTIDGAFAGTTCDPSTTLTVGTTETTGFVGASNCGPAVTIAAPGSDVFVVTPDGYGTVGGTSAAAPIVSSIAALLLAVRGTSDLSPSDLRSLLVNTSDDLGLQWQPGPMGQIDALGAVRAVLPTTQHEAVYVADRDRGVVVALEIDPLTGKPRIPAVPDRVIPLTLTKQGVALEAINPLGVAMSPAGEQIYVLVRALSPNDLGDGIMIISTQSERAIDFIPLSGATFPRVPSPLTPGAVTVRKYAPMVVSRDGYLLYVGANDSLVVINTIDAKVVRTYMDLPAAFRQRADSRPVYELANRLHDVQKAVEDGVQNKARPGTEISALTLSPDGTTLYAAFMTGGGGGNQPGGIVPVSVDLFKDEQPGIFGLQSDLTAYLTSSATLEMSSPGSVGQGDEPFAVAVGHDNRYVYMFNGGYEQVLAAGPEALGLAGYGELVGGAGFGIAAETAGSAGIAGTLNAINTSADIGSTLSNSMAREFLQQAQGGVGLIVAPGFTAAFDMANGGQESWLFPSEVVVGWNVRPPGNIVTDADTGLIVTQFSQPEVFAKRPMAVALSPGGGSGPLANTRALVAFGQSGNFGVLDLFSQGQFRRLTPPNAAFAALPANLFQALVGVTPSIPIGPFTWPDRGTFASGDSGLVVPSPDEALLFTSALVYAQNGRFAVATHAGRDLPTQVDAVVPDFVNDPVHAREPLLALGFTYAGGNTIVAPDGTSYQPGQPISFDRGGGAISFIDDAAITRDLDAHIDATVSDDDGRPRPYFSRIPICNTVSMQPGTDEPEPRCAIDAVTRVFGYKDGTTPTRFSEPRGVAIQPYVMFETPRSGTHVSLDSPVHVTWRDPLIDEFKMLVLDLDQLDSNGLPTEINTQGRSLTPEQLQAHAMAAQFGGLFPAAPNGPKQGHRYQVVVALFRGTDEVSRASIDVRFDQPTGPIVPETLTLGPVILAIGTAPGTARISATLHQPGAADRDVTTSASYNLVGNHAPGLALAAAIQQKLAASLAPGQTQTGPFGIIPGATVDPSGRVSATQPGLEVLTAADDGVTSRPTLVLAGFTVKKIALEPLAAESAAEQHTLGDEVVLTFGKGTNAPLVIEPHDSRFIDDDGQIYLDDVVLQYAGGGTIHLSDLMDVLRAAPGDLSIEAPFQDAIRHNLSPLGATATWRNAQALTGLLEGPDTPFLSTDLALATSDTPTAFVQQGGFFSGRIASNVSGLAVVTGTLDLGGFGRRSDGVLVWSLPAIESVRVDPSVLEIRRTDAPTPGPSLRARALVAPTAAVLQLPSGFADTATFLQETMPDEFAVGRAPAIAVSKSGVFRFDISGTATPTATGVSVADLRIEFDVPNDRGPFVAVTYGIADTAILRLGDTAAFDQHVIHQNTAGSTAVTVDVTIDGMGAGHGSGQISVCDCPAPPAAGLEASAPVPHLRFVLPAGTPPAPAPARAPPSPAAEEPVRKGAQR
ncbi:MAG TPA: S8 family serine peptidase, partial [Vicinamibacterales bacterium]